jgi:hypothetical protein
MITRSKTEHETLERTVRNTKVTTKVSVQFRNKEIDKIDHLPESVRHLTVLSQTNRTYLSLTNTLLNVEVPEKLPNC